MKPLRKSALELGNVGSKPALVHADGTVELMLTDLQALVWRCADGKHDVDALIGRARGADVAADAAAIEAAIEDLEDVDVIDVVAEGDAVAMGRRRALGLLGKGAAALAFIGLLTPKSAQAARQERADDDVSEPERYGKRKKPAKKRKVTKKKRRILERKRKVTKKKRKVYDRKKRRVD